MNNIYTITVMSKLEADELGWPHFGDTRTVGWLETEDLAREAVEGNYGDIWETCYDYAIVEEVEQGLYPCATERWFYKYDMEKQIYHEIPAPEFMKGFVNIGIG